MSKTGATIIDEIADVKPAASKEEPNNVTKKVTKKSTKKKDTPIKVSARTHVTDDTYLTPGEIVTALDKYIVGQDAAKRSVAIALRNRWRRRRAPEDIRDDILPNNIIMIGPTGVGKTEIARRLADLVGAPFVKVEASKFTEVGYVGRDVESMIRDLVDLSVNIVKKEKSEDVDRKADENTDERILDLLLPKARPSRPTPNVIQEALSQIVPGVKKVSSSDASVIDSTTTNGDSQNPEDDKTRDKFREMLKNGKLDHRMIEITITQNAFPIVEIFTPQGMEELGVNFQEMFSGLAPQKTRRRKTTVAEARKIIHQQEIAKLVNMDEVISEALNRAQESGIIFLDEIDKIAGEKAKSGPDVSREGVQRDILPIVEGCTVSTKYGMVSTDHILFVAAGAFHGSKPSDLIPELQGRFPIRVELDSLNAKDFERILTEPKNALIKQYTALLASENVKITFSDDAVKKLAEIAEAVNTSSENIGARRLHTIMSALLEDVMFEAPGRRKTVNVNEKMVTKILNSILEDEDLSRYIL